MNRFSHRHAGSPPPLTMRRRAVGCRATRHAYATLNRRTSISCVRARICHRSYAICMPSHVSGDDPNAFESRIAI